MEKEKIESACSIIDSLDYIDKRDVFSRCFDLNNNQSTNMNDFLVLISLVSLSYIKLKEKDPLTTPLSILCKLTNQIKDNSYFYKYLENISILVEILTPGIKTIDTCGLKSSNEIFDKIKEILNKWMPF